LIYFPVLEILFHIALKWVYVFYIFLEFLLLLSVAAAAAVVLAAAVAATIFFNKAVTTAWANNFELYYLLK
jgi:hypothetical protein